MTCPAGTETISGETPKYGAVKLKTMGVMI
jgi:hypothetical protein